MDTIKNALNLQKPVSNKSSDNRAMYKATSDNEKAHKVDIGFGMFNRKVVEVISGAKEGYLIIISAIPENTYEVVKFK